jgi:hypothetical protein
LLLVAGMILAGFGDTSGRLLLIFGEHFLNLLFSLTKIVFFSLTLELVFQVQVLGLHKQLLFLLVQHSDALVVATAPRGRLVTRVTVVRVGFFTGHDDNGFLFSFDSFLFPFDCRLMSYNLEKQSKIFF